MSELKDRLKTARKNAKMTQAQLAKAVPISQGTISDLESGRNKGTASLVKIAQALKVNAHWLATGEGEMNYCTDITKMHGYQEVEQWDDNTPLDDDDIPIPFYKELAFACGHGAVNPDIHSEHRKLRMGKHTLKNLNIDKNNAFAATAKDDSMSPYIQDGDTICIDKGRTQIKDGRIFAIRHGELFLCKRLYRLPDGGVRIVSDNQAEYPEQIVRKSEIEQGDFEVIGWVWNVSRLERW